VGEKSWEAVVMDDFAELREAKLKHSLMDETRSDSLHGDD
jgi:hypothetical protein